MPEPSLDALIAQIKQGIEDRQFAGAREIFNATVKRWGASPSLTRLRLSLERAEEDAHRPQVEKLEKEAQQQLTRGNYGSAIDALRQATGLLPHDGNLRLSVQQAERALARHQTAITREREVQQQARQIETLIAREQLDAAREALREANRTSGGHRALEHLEKRLQGLDRERQRGIANQRLLKARKLLDAGDWHTALAELDRALEADPQLSEVEPLRQQARASLELEQGRRFTEQAIDEARQDVERLLTARELRRADQRLDEAISVLGRQEIFSRLGRRIDEAKAGVQAVRRREWATRRHREATAKLHEADRLLRGKRYQQALECLRAAERIEPDLEGLDSKLSTTLEALERQQQVQLKAQQEPPPPPRPPLPERRPAPALTTDIWRTFAVLTVALVVAELLSMTRALAALGLGLRIALLLVALACQLAWVRQAATTDQDPPLWKALAAPRPLLRDFATTLALTVICLAPLGLWLVWRQAGLVGESANLASWLIALALGWAGFATWVSATLAAAGFGRRRASWFRGHFGSFGITEVDSHQLVTGATALVAVAVLARALLGMPGQLIAAVLEAGLLVAAPWLLGRILRRWRGSLKSLYA